MLLPLCLPLPPALGSARTVWPQAPSAHPSHQGLALHTPSGLRLPLPTARAWLCTHWVASGSRQLLLTPHLPSPQPLP